MLNNRIIKRSLAGGLVIAAAGFPATAQAMLINGGGGDPSAPAVAAPSSAPAVAIPHDASSGGYRSVPAATPSVSQTGSGFHWDDAGIGAAGATVILLSAGALGTSATRRRRRPVVS